MPQISSNWRELCLTEVRKWFSETLTTFDSMLPKLYTMATTDREEEYDVGYTGIGNFKRFTGSAVSEATMTEEYKKTVKFPQWMNWIDIQRQLWDDRRNRTVMNMAKEFALSAKRSKEGHGAEPFNYAFTATGTYSGGDSTAGADGVALCSDSHPSKADSTYLGDNLITGALSQTTLGNLRDAFRGFTDGKGNKNYAKLTTLLIPANAAMEETAYELTKSPGKPYTADNEVNFHQGRYDTIVWDELTDSDAYFGLDRERMKMALTWFTRVDVEDYDEFNETLQTLRFIGYMRYGMGFNGWRWIVGSQGA